MDTQANFIFWKCIWGFVVTYFAYVSPFVVNVEGPG